jgi:hypothetical protein
MYYSVYKVRTGYSLKNNLWLPGGSSYSFGADPTENRLLQLFHCCVLISVEKDRDLQRNFLAKTGCLGFWSLAKNIFSF